MLSADAYTTHPPDRSLGPVDAILQPATVMHKTSTKAPPSAAERRVYSPQPRPSTAREPRAMHGSQADAVCVLVSSRDRQNSADLRARACARAVL